MDESNGNFRKYGIENVNATNTIIVISSNVFKR